MWFFTTQSRDTSIKLFQFSRDCRFTTFSWKLRNGLCSRATLTGWGKTNGRIGGVDRHSDEWWEISSPDERFHVTVSWDQFYLNSNYDFQEITVESMQFLVALGASFKYFFSFPPLCLSEKAFPEKCLQKCFSRLTLPKSSERDFVMWTSSARLT